MFSAWLSWSETLVVLDHVFINVNSSEPPPRVAMSPYLYSSPLRHEGMRAVKLIAALLP